MLPVTLHGGAEVSCQSIDPIKPMTAGVNQKLLPWKLVSFSPAHAWGAVGVALIGDSAGVATLGGSPARSTTQAIQVAAMNWIAWPASPCCRMKSTWTKTGISRTAARGIARERHNATAIPSRPRKPPLRA